MKPRFTPRPGGLSLERALPLARQLWPEIGELEPLFGGFSNANFRAPGGPVVRVVASGWESACREAAVMARVKAAGIACPAVLDCRQLDGHALLLLEYVAGKPLSRYRGQRAYRVLGQTLAALHSLSFPHAGGFGADGSLQPWPDGFVEGLLEGYLNGRAGRRLGPLLEPVRRWLTLPPAGPIGLVHSDFNPKNVLVTGQGVCILDWEFAMAADPLIDLGNFFRFENDYSPRQRQAFLEGYGRLPEGWRLAARRHDLVSMLDMLDSPLELPETFATALAVVEESLRS